jgi:hypothetical protein
MVKRYTAKELNQMHTISESQADDLKVEKKNKYRIWLSRMTIEDGMPYNNQITEEKFDSKSGTWKTVREYEG